MAIKITQAKDGRPNPWIVAVTARGKRKRVGFPDEASANQYVNAYQELLKRGQVEPGRTAPKFGDLYEQWLTNHAEVNCKASTVAGYKTALS